MSRNHDQHAIANPIPYQGQVIKPSTAEADQIYCSIVEAANYLDVYPIIERFGDWIITEYGVECLRMSYPVYKGRFHEDDWITHVGKKTWVNQDDFAAALTRARQLVASNQL